MLFDPFEGVFIKPPVLRVVGDPEVKFIALSRFEGKEVMERCKYSGASGWGGENCVFFSIFLLIKSSQFCFRANGKF
jgi:hypothetical protein